MIAKDGGSGASSAASASFNLIDEPWIMVRYLDGNTREVSLLQLLDQMQNIEQIAGELPTQDFAVFRTILAIFYRALDIETKEEWFECYNDPEMVCSDVREYLAAMHDRFDLRHPEYPFYQVADLHTAKNETKSVSVIIGDIPSGHQFFVSRKIQEDTIISWAEAARWLIYAHQYDPAGIRSGVEGDPRVKGGKSYPIGTGWAGQIGGIWFKGKNFFNTVMRNIIPTDEIFAEQAYENRQEDCPAWEKVGKAGSRDTFEYQIPSGVIDILTWQARRIRLIGSDEGVRAVVLTNGDRVKAHNQFSVEPLSSWRFSNPQSTKEKSIIYMPKMHGQAEQVWRGLPALMPQLENEEEHKINGKLVRIKRYIIAGVIEWNAQISTIQEKYDPILNLQVVGVSYGTQQSVIDDIVSDQLVLPRRLFDSSDKALALTVYDAVKVVDAVAKAVFVLASQTSQAAGQSTEEAKAPAEDYKRKFYSNVDRDFRQWLKDLEDPSDQEKLARYLRRAANDMEQEITESLPTDILFAASRAINRYRRVVNESLKNSLLIDLHNNQKGSAAKEKEGRDGK